MLTAVAIRSTLATVFYDFSGNGLDGIYISSEGAVSVGNALASGNGQFGLNIDRDTGTGAISVTRGTFDYNGYGGVQILTTPGVITLTDVTASGNDTIDDGNDCSGLHIDATYGGVPGGSVTIKSSTLTKFFEFSDNKWRGIAIFAFGPIAVSNVIAEGNKGTNILLDNTYADTLAPKPVSVAFSTANGSTDGYGFFIETKGNVTLNTLTANENLNGYGLYINASDASVLIPATVTMTGARNEFSATAHMECIPKLKAISR